MGFLVGSGLTSCGGEAAQRFNYAVTSHVVGGELKTLTA